MASATTSAWCTAGCGGWTTAYRDAGTRPPSCRRASTRCGSGCGGCGARCEPIWACPGRILAADGCDGVDLHRSVEHPTRYRLMVRWETVEHHTVTFRASEGFARWRALAGPHFAAPPQVEHVRSVLAHAEGP
ncbi:antibiotic biosynthesis monooxygenase [Streptomyces sp. NPDC044984]|uniref:putative quinol monooxygenase n=1 Tax=Streptomyces sp. NPDC044984 TaxID=3154335 RepID=UPI0033D55808